MKWIQDYILSITSSSVMVGIPDLCSEDHLTSAGRPDRSFRTSRSSSTRFAHTWGRHGFYPGSNLSRPTQLIYLQRSVGPKMGHMCVRWWPTWTRSWNTPKVWWICTPKWKGLARQLRHLCPEEGPEPRGDSNKASQAAVFRSRSTRCSPGISASIPRRRAKMMMREVRCEMRQSCGEMLGDAPKASAESSSFSVSRGRSTCGWPS